MTCAAQHASRSDSKCKIFSQDFKISLTFADLPPSHQDITRLRAKSQLGTSNSQESPRLPAGPAWKGVQFQASMPTISHLLRIETGDSKDLAAAQGRLRRLSNLGAFREMPVPSERTLELTDQLRGTNRRFSHIRGTFEITIEDDDETSERGDALVPVEENLCVAPGPQVRHDRCGKKSPETASETVRRAPRKRQTLDPRP